jgi:uncharacterized membrane protein YuzA (DUF378 family)
MNSDCPYFRKKAFAVAILFLVIGGINIGFLTLFKHDFVREMFGKNTIVTNLIFLTVGISALFIGFYRDTYLPFLGPTIMPSALLNPQVPKDADFEVQVSLRPGLKVLYWASEPANKNLQYIQNWRNAYNDYTNAGVAVADGSGKATLRVRKPQPYNVPIKGELEPHIHYRVCNDNGWIGTVQTVTLDNKEFFENVVAEQETNEPIADPLPAPEPPKPADAMEKLNAKAAETANNSLMVETGAPDEFRPEWLGGAKLELAYP